MRQDKSVHGNQFWKNAMNPIKEELVSEEPCTEELRSNNTHSSQEPKPISGRSQESGTQSEAGTNRERRH